jgi:tripartite-type tricarboxylate transporter receptor subunit TctC
VVDKLNAEINAGLATPKLKAQLTDLGETPLMGSPTAFGRLIVEETEKWGKVIRAAKIKPERNYLLVSLQREGAFSGGWFW